MYNNLSKKIIKEIEIVLKKVNSKEVDIMVKEILKAKKVFVIGVGRVFLAMQCLAKRLAQLGIDVQVVGSITEKPVSSKDLLLVASGSGESKIPVEIAKLALRFNAKIGLITSAENSTIKDMADFVVCLSCPTKNEPCRGVKSVQPMSILFDQALHIFGDTIALMIQKCKKITNKEIWKYHANLE